MPDSLYATSMLELLAYYATDDDSSAVAARQQWGLPKLMPTDVTIVTDSATCHAAYQAYLSAYEPIEPHTSRAVVIRMAHLRATVPEPEEIAFSTKPILISDSTFTGATQLFWP